jgi:hypothetical protein
MEAHVGAKGPGAIGKFSFTSANARESPKGTLFSACGGGTSGNGATLVSAVKLPVAAINARAENNGIPKLTVVVLFIVNLQSTVKSDRIFRFHIALKSHPNLHYSKRNNSSLPPVNLKYSSCVPLAPVARHDRTIHICLRLGEDRSS